MVGPRLRTQLKKNCTMGETLVVNGLRTNLTDTWRNSGNARRRQGKACVHRVEDGVKKHRGLTAASSSLRVSRHVTLRRRRPVLSKSQPARTSRAVGTYLRTQSVVVGVSARYISAFAGRHACVPGQATTKGLRVQYLRAFRARMTRQARACSFALETHAHSRRPSHHRLA